MNVYQRFLIKYDRFLVWQKRDCWTRVEWLYFACGVWMNEHVENFRFGDFSIYFSTFYVRCASINEEFEYFFVNVQRIMMEETMINCFIRNAPVKSLDRCVEKIEVDYHDRYFPISANILDINRCSLTFGSIRDLIDGHQFINNLFDRNKSDLFYRSDFRDCPIQITQIVRTKNEYVFSILLAQIPLKFQFFLHFLLCHVQPKWHRNQIKDVKIKWYYCNNWGKWCHGGKNMTLCPRGCTWHMQTSFIISIVKKNGKLEKRMMLETFISGHKVFK